MSSKPLLHAHSRSQVIKLLRAAHILRLDPDLDPESAPSCAVIGIELGDTKEIGSLVDASTYSAVDAEIGLLLISLSPSRFRVKQA